DLDPDQRLAAGDPDGPDAVPLHEELGQAADLLEAQDVLPSQPFESLGRHAVDAAEVAAVGDRDPQVVGDPPVAVPQHPRHMTDDTQVAFEFIQASIEAPIGVITLNRPKVLNALSPELIAELGTALVELDRDPEVRAVVLTGGPRVFAAGADIGDMADRSAVDQLTRDQTGRWAPLTSFSKPLIAAVNGYA